MENEEILIIKLEAMRIVLSAIAAKANISNERLKELLDITVENVTQVYMEQNNEMLN